MGFEWLPKKNYKRHYICLKCQKGFKRDSKQDVKDGELSDLSSLMIDYYTSETKLNIVKYINTAYKKLKVTCPNCKNRMLQVHYDFEIPKQRDLKSWKTLQETLADKLNINYNTYIQWHNLELKKGALNTSKIKFLKQNLKKLKDLNNF